MSRDIAEADWKVLRKVHPLALERYCERVLAEIEHVTHNRAQSNHQRYLDVFKIVEQRDREMARIFNDPKRSKALTMLARIHADGLLTEDEFSSLSPETRSAIELLRGAVCTSEMATLSRFFGLPRSSARAALAAGTDERRCANG